MRFVVLVFLSKRIKTNCFGKGGWDHIKSAASSFAETDDSSGILSEDVLGGSLFVFSNSRGDTCFCSIPFLQS